LPGAPVLRNRGHRPRAGGGQVLRQMIGRTGCAKTLLATSGKGGRRRLCLAAAGWFASLLCLAPPVPAKSWRITDFNDHITVNLDGSAVITERMSLLFEGEWHGIHRT